jgi:predicted RNase H-like HicB family nuclease
VSTGCWLARIDHAASAWQVLGTVTLTIELEQEADGRWIAEIPQLPGVLTYGVDADNAAQLARALAFRVLADRIELGRHMARNVADRKDESSRSVAYLLTPLLAMLLAGPALMLIASPLWWVSLPHVAGVLAAPGFTYAWADAWRKRPPGPGTVRWMNVSLLLALAASLAGTVMSAAFGVVIATPFAAISAWECIVLLRRVADHRAPSNHRLE